MAKERDLMQSGNLLCGEGGGLTGGKCKYNHLVSSAYCTTRGGDKQYAGNVARCSGNHNRKPICRKVWDMDTEAWVQALECAAADGVPACLIARFSSTLVPLI
jgi:hypothetical protein